MSDEYNDQGGDQQDGNDQQDGGDGEGGGGLLGGLTSMLGGLGLGGLVQNLLGGGDKQDQDQGDGGDQGNSGDEQEA